jgi:hypothetical protein
MYMSKRRGGGAIAPIPKIPLSLDIRLVLSVDVSCQHNDGKCTE